MDVDKFVHLEPAQAPSPSPTTLTSLLIAYSPIPTDPTSLLIAPLTWSLHAVPNFAAPNTCMVNIPVLISRMAKEPPL
jgi:hypothetical protein